MTPLLDHPGTYRYGDGVRCRLRGELVSQVFGLGLDRLVTDAAFVCDHAPRQSVRVEAKDHLLGFSERAHALRLRHLLEVARERAFHAC